MKKVWLGLLLLCLLLPFAAQAKEYKMALTDEKEMTMCIDLIGTQRRVGEAPVLEGIYQLTLTHDGEVSPFQTLYFSQQISEDSQPFEDAGLNTQDLDGDGYGDLDISCSPNAPNTDHIIFMFNPQLGRYESRDIGVAALSNITVSPDTKTVLNYIRDSALTGIHELYQWQNGKLVLLRRAELMAQAPDYGTVRNCVMDYTQGKVRMLLDETYSINDLDEAFAGELYEERMMILWEGAQ